MFVPLHDAWSGHLTAMYLTTHARAVAAPALRALPQGVAGASTRAEGKTPASAAHAPTASRLITVPPPRAPVFREPAAPPVRLPPAFAGFECDASHPLLGSGAFAKVFRVTDRSSGTVFAVKVMERSFFEIRAIGQLIEREVRSLRLCAERGACRHIIRLLDAAEDSGSVFLRLELCEGSLLHYVREQPGCRLAEFEARKWSAQLFAGLADLHGLQILHRDIKPDNLLYTADGSLKITDFGWCANLCDSPCDIAGTFQYMAPEVMTKQVHTEATDVWSAGATIFELVTGVTLLSSTAPEVGPEGPVFTHLMLEVLERCPPAREVRPSFVSLRCWEMIRLMLVREVAARATLGALRSDAWLQDARVANNRDAVADAGLLDKGSGRSCRYLAAAAPSSDARLVQSARTRVLTPRAVSRHGATHAEASADASADAAPPTPTAAGGLLGGAGTTTVAAPEAGGVVQLGRGVSGARSGCHLAAHPQQKVAARAVSPPARLLSPSRVLSRSRVRPPMPAPLASRSANCSRRTGNGEQAPGPRVHARVPSDGNTTTPVSDSQSLSGTPTTPGAWTPTLASPHEVPRAAHIRPREAAVAADLASPHAAAASAVDCRATLAALDAHHAAKVEHTLQPVVPEPLRVVAMPHLIQAGHQPVTTCWGPACLSPALSKVPVTLGAGASLTISAHGCRSPPSPIGRS